MRIVHLTFLFHGLPFYESLVSVSLGIEKPEYNEKECQYWPEESLKKYHAWRGMLFVKFTLHHIADSDAVKYVPRNGNTDKI